MREELKVVWGAGRIMMIAYNKTAKLILLASVLLLQIAAAQADYYPDEKPVWGLSQDTAYLLERGKMDVNMYGWVTLGVLDNLQVGMNLPVYLMTITNINAKARIIEENQNMPQVALGLSYYRPIFYDGYYWDSTLYLSKTLTEEQHWLYGSIKLFGNSMSVPDYDFKKLEGINYTLGTVLAHDQSFRSYYEIAYDNIYSGTSSSFRCGLGFEKAWGVCRFRYGIANSGGVIIPVINFSLRSL